MKKKTDFSFKKLYNSNKTLFKGAIIALILLLLLLYYFLVYKKKDEENKGTGTGTGTDADAVKPTVLSQTAPVNPVITKAVQTPVTTTEGTVTVITSPVEAPVITTEGTVTVITEPDPAPIVTEPDPVPIITIQNEDPKLPPPPPPPPPPAPEPLLTESQKAAAREHGKNIIIAVKLLSAGDGTLTPEEYNAMQAGEALINEGNLSRFTWNTYKSSAQHASSSLTVATRTRRVRQAKADRIARELAAMENELNS